MKNSKEGGSHKAVCEKCKSIEKATFKFRDVPFSDNSGIAKNILVGICDKCDSVISLPHSSSVKIKKLLAD